MDLKDKEEIAELISKIILKDLKESGYIKQKIKKMETLQAKALREKCWNIYSCIYSINYRTKLPRNLTANTLISKLASMFGELTPRIIEFYLSSKHKFYIDNAHDLKLLLRDAQKIYTAYIQKYGEQNGQTSSEDQPA
jgi:hypothetical protein